MRKIRTNVAPCGLFASRIVKIYFLNPARDSVPNFQDKIAKMSVCVWPLLHDVWAAHLEKMWLSFTIPFVTNEFQRISRLSFLLLSVHTYGESLLQTSNKCYATLQIVWLWVRANVSWSLSACYVSKALGTHRTISASARTARSFWYPPISSHTGILLLLCKYHHPSSPSMPTHCSACCSTGVKCWVQSWDLKIQI